ncbi:flagellin [Ectobacillus antri]|jgi:flagellin|uniref:Flagellin n=1 Tax=Ectobacillus antri TaxID=2486280 RepID=A0ABT6H259_9BACI|nr:flagellin [Ectobacillus antri]MDG4656208.1 flagellin [Ectobacillus antri]MDG5752883.1 flagellin [Ectobacillus antri]
MKINTNINSMKTQEYMRQNQAKMDQAMNRLSSGKRINSASDDAAGLAIATRMRAKESGLGVAARNTQDGISMIQTAESALSSVSNILVRMRDLAVQAANGTNDTTDKSALQGEFQQLTDQITYITDNTKFNGAKLLDGSAGTAGIVSIQTYDGDTAGQQITVDLTKAKTDTTTLGVNGLDISTGALAAVTALDTALTKVATGRAELGATLNRLDYNISNINSEATNMAASASRIEDADMAKEMSEMTKYKILSEAGVSMLSQANQSAQAVSKLLQG